MEESQETDIVYDQENPIASLDMYFVFSCPDGKAISKEFSKVLLDMKKDGTFAKIMKKIEKK